MFDQDMYLKAWLFASEKHNSQLLPGTDLPYIVHVGAVTMEVMGALAHDSSILRADLAVSCALLHDTLEDTGATQEELSRVFGKDITNGVCALTKDAALPSKQEQMVDSLRRIALQPREIGIVKLADRITNLQPPPAYWTPQKCAAYQAEAGIILEALAGSCSYLEDRLSLKMSEYTQYTT